MSESIDPQFAFNLGRPAIPDAIPGFDDFGYIRLKKVKNVRDLGGMPTVDGKSIRPHRLIRAGELHDATKDDAAVLMDEHRLERIVDFRTSVESNAQPDDMARFPGVVLIEDPVFSEEAVGITHGSNPVQELRELLDSPDGPFMKVQALYEKAVLADEGVAAYKKFMETLLNADEGATLWHCTEGKDRTGIGAFLIEYALGVSMEDIRADYLATNVYAREGFEKILDRFAHVGIAKGLDADMDAFMYAYLGYLDHAIQSIEGEYGTIDAYLDKALGVDSAAVAELRAKYLA